MEREPITQPDWVKKEGERIQKQLRDAEQDRAKQQAQPQRVTVVPDSRADEQALAFLRDAKPNALKDGKGLRGRNDALVQRFTDFGPGSINRSTRVDTPRRQDQQQVTESVGFSPNISFLLQDATTTEEGVETNKVLVFDGKINGEFPAGMGTGDYELDLASPEDSLIYAGLTFNPTTLAITSRFLGVSGSGDYPESRIESATSGFVYWLLGFTYFNDDGNFTVWQTKLGNIDFSFIYGAANGRPALYPLDCQPGSLDLDALYP